MAQSSVILFGLLIGFIVFITIRGELAAYLNVLGISGGAPGSTLGLPPQPVLSY